MTSRADRIEEARDFLRLVNFDPERYNERSALVLLALLDLFPDRPWSAAETPLLRTVQIIDWLRDHYEKSYAPNTRETIRRFSLHQFAEAALVVQNPDQPDRPVNSPNTCYQVSPAAVQLARRYGTPEFEQELRQYLVALPGLQAAYARARDLQRIPATMPGGAVATLSAGGQNVLLKQMIEDFCGYFTPGGQVLYVGDADEKWMIFAEDDLTALGVTVDSHGKMPDLVVFLPDRNWLVLMEAATSHGPVDGKRYHELQALFASATAGLVYVSCFPSREVMRKYFNQIAWETDAWCADNPTHLIHFNGERFLGPYDDSPREPHDGGPR